VQDAAYDSLLKRRRQELHAKIARVIEQRFPHIQTTEPEVLAHHLTAAGLAEAAIPLWQAAGELALKRLALTEAISHLERGLELISTLPRSPERDASELELRTCLGTAWIALRGSAAPEVWTSLHPALALARSLGRHDALVPILSGLTNNILNQGRVAESLPWVEEMLDIAKATGDADLLIVGHARACTCYCFAGGFTKVLEHADKVLDLYDAEKHRHLADVLNQDPKTAADSSGSISTWILGYPDRALRLVIQRDAHARRRGHPFDLGYALMRGAHEFDDRYSYEDLRKRAEEVERLGRENNLPFLWAAQAPRLYGRALLREGKLAEALVPLKVGLAAYEATGARLGSPNWKLVLVDAMALTDDLNNALHLLDEVITQAERPGWEERLHYAEALRLKGWVLSLKGDFASAE
jgi:tetratricopeptide (TPR) repeat protein